MKYVIFILLTGSIFYTQSMDSFLRFFNYTSTATHKLFKAASTNDVTGMVTALANGAKINAHDADGDTPLH
nr:hypothetical protein [Candidatus Dependentiae bacterium]